MQIPVNIKNKFIPFAKHEAGHWVVANILGFPTSNISFEINGVYPLHKGFSVIELDFNSSNIQDVIDYCENRIQVLYSGALAQSLKNGNVDNSVLDFIYKNNASADMANVRELIRIVRSFKYSSAKTETEIQDSLNAVENDLLKKAGKLVEANYKAIEEIGIEIIKGVINLNSPYILIEADIKNIVAKY